MPLRPDLHPGSVEITWLRQAGFLIQGPTSAVLVDAFLTDFDGTVVPPGRTPEELAWVDVVLATHEHADHFDGPAWGRIATASSTTRFVVPEPVVALAVDAGVPADRVVGARPDAPLEFNDLRIEPLPALHGVEVADAYTHGLELEPPGYRYLGYVVDLNGVRIYHAGDTIVYEGMADRLLGLRPDVALVPINGRDFFREAQGIVGNFDIREAAELAAEIGVDLVIPMHYDAVAGNTQAPGPFVDHVRATHPDLPVLLPARLVPFVYTRSAGRPQ
ncbi:MAG TPA: MBL fold metallo-hydrolase [Candidatus Limnocylindrales bacterium]